MNLQPQAEAEPERRTRSKLEAHREAIFALRRKHWTHKQIAQWLNEHGVTITLSSVHRFCERSTARRPRNASPLEVEPATQNFIPTPQTTTTNKTTNQYRFNLEI